jgi:large subunit ribosomal protein L21
MYAVIATGGKQYRVEKGAVLRIEKLAAEPGSTVEFNEVLLVGDGDQVRLGTPLLSGGKVLAMVEKHARTRKVAVVKFRRRKHYLRQQTHRQPFTEVRITEITVPS